MQLKVFYGGQYQIMQFGPPAKRGCSMLFYPPSQTVDTSPNTGQALRLPKGKGGVQSQWKLISATLRLEAPNANATTVQAYYATPGNAAFGAGTACLADGTGAAAALSGTGTSAFETAPPRFTGTLGSAGVPSGTVIAALWSALAAYVTGQKAPGICLELEWEEV